MKEDRNMSVTKAIVTRLPPSLELRDVPIAEALLALSQQLTEIADRMALLSDVSCDLDIQNGRATLRFRACR